MTSWAHRIPLGAWLAAAFMLGWWGIYLLVRVAEWFHFRRRLVISIRIEGALIMATAISVADTHAPLQLSAGYVNAKGKPVPAPAGAPPLKWSVSDPALATDAPADAADVITLTGADGAFSVSVTDGTFSDSLPVTVTPDQTPAGIAITVANP